MDDDSETHEYFATRIFRAPADIIRPSPAQLEEAENANLFERAQVLAAVLNDDEVDDTQEEGENTVGLDHVGDAVPAKTAKQRYAMHDMKKPSKYQIDIGGGNTMHIVTLLALLSSWYVTSKGITLSKDRVARIIQSAKIAKTQSADIGGTIAQGLVEGNGTDIVVSGSWIALAFEDDAKVGNFRSWIGMIQKIVHRPPKGKPSLWTSSISLDDERIKDMFLNVAWLTPCNDVSPREALEYKWLPYSDAEDVCASYIINVPDVTYSPDTFQYSLCAQDLRRLNDYLDTIADTIDPISEPNKKKKKTRQEKQSSNSLVGDTGYAKIYTQGGSQRSSRVRL